MVDGINAVDKRYIYQLMSKVQLPRSIRFDSQIKIHTGNEKKDVSLAQEFKFHLEEEYLQKWSHLSRKIKNIHENKTDRKKVSCSE